MNMERGQVKGQEFCVMNFYINYDLRLL